MDLFFLKKTNKVVFKDIKLPTKKYLNINIYNNIRLVCYNQIHLNYIYFNNKLSNHFYNGTILVLYNQYLRSFRKTFIPWNLSINLSNTIRSGWYGLYLSYYNLRHRRVISKYTNKRSLFIIYSWSSKYYKTPRIKRWLRKKYSNHLWR